MRALRWTSILIAVGIGVALLDSCSTNTGTGDQFVGSDKCSGCHTGEYASWKDTYHSKMVRSTRDGLLKDALDNWSKDAKGNAGPTKGNIDSKPYGVNDVELVVGSKWKQRYLVKNPATGNHQFMDKQWNSYTRLWEGYGQSNDWETNCATCHVTGYRLTAYDPANPAAQKYEYAEKNIGCEACHGPGSRHVSTRNKADIFNPKNVSKAEASKVCGYCHLRGENYQFETAQKHPREDLPAPVLGTTYRAGTDDWTKWYVEKELLPGIHSDDPISKNYPKTDLNDAFFTDEAAQKSGYFEARKHHQEYQEVLQSKHSKLNVLSCIDCHSAHTVKGKTIDTRATCNTCHGDKYPIAVYMPGTGRTAGDLYIRSHVFNPNPRKGGATSADLKPPVYAYPQK